MGASWEGLNLGWVLRCRVLQYEKRWRIRSTGDDG